MGREVSGPAAFPVLCQERRQSWPVVKMFSWVLGLVHFGFGGVWVFLVGFQVFVLVVLFLFVGLFFSLRQAFLCPKNPHQSLFMNL